MTFHLGRCRISVSFYFFAVIALLCCIDSGAVMLSGILAAVIHESGHLAAMLILPGHHIDAVDITALGLRITSREGDMMRGWWIAAAAGIAANAAAAAILMLMLMPSEFCRMLAISNLCLAAINLCPVIPLDGGQLVRIMLDRRLGCIRAERISFAISLAALIPMTAFGLYILMRSRGNFSLLALCLWLLSCILREYI